MADVIINDRVWRKLLKRVKRGSAAPHAKVGLLASQGAGDEHPDGDGITLVEIAATHEFGEPAANIPERSSIRRTVEERRRQFEQLTATLAKAIVEDKATMARALDLLGAWGAGEIKKRIGGGEPIPPPLAKATVERKGSDRPLVETGSLVGAIAHEVEE